MKNLNTCLILIFLITLIASTAQSQTLQTLQTPQILLTQNAINEQATYLEKGTPAPYDGDLLPEGMLSEIVSKAEKADFYKLQLDEEEKMPDLSKPENKGQTFLIGAGCGALFVGLMLIIFH
jgi:hypothetical protein